MWVYLGCANYNKVNIYTLYIHVIIMPKIIYYLYCILLLVKYYPSSKYYYIL